MNPVPTAKDVVDLYSNLLHFSTYVFLGQYYNIVGYVDIGYCDTSSTGLFTQDYFGYSGSFLVLHQFHDFFSSSVKEVIDVFMGITFLNL